MSRASKICAVIDYGMGNLHSAHGALQTVAPDTQVLVTGDPDVIRRADHVVLPGVGHFPHMEDKAGFAEAVSRFLNSVKADAVPGV